MGCAKGKVTYTQKSTARRAAKQLRKREIASGKKLSYYYCKQCSGYHLTKRYVPKSQRTP